MYNWNARGWGVIRSRKLSTWITAISELWWSGEILHFQGEQVWGHAHLGLTPNSTILALSTWQVSTLREWFPNHVLNNSIWPGMDTCATKKGVLSSNMFGKYRIKQISIGFFTEGLLKAFRRLWFLVGVGTDGTGYRKHFPNSFGYKIHSSLPITCLSNWAP